MSAPLGLSDLFKAHPPEFDQPVHVAGAFNNPVTFPMYCRRVSGAVLFADLPRFTEYSRSTSPELCLYAVNLFFGWVATVAHPASGYVIDKFIGDEVMIVFVPELGATDPLLSALCTARALLGPDLFNFKPKIGIATGEFVVGKVGYTDHFSFSAVGFTVNLAARCVSGLEPRRIRVATGSRDAVETVFGNDDGWRIEGPRSEEFDGTGSVSIVEVIQTTMRLGYCWQERVAQVKGLPEGGTSDGR